MSKPDDEDEPFLARWSRRKRDAQVRPSQARAIDVETRSDDVPEADRTGAEPDKAKEEQELDLSKLPKVEELTAESDISVFLDKRVPQLLRNAALSRMWSLDPTIRDFIEVAENQWNWNVPGGAPFYEDMLSVPGDLGQAVAQAGSEAGRLLVRHTNENGAGAGQALASGDIRPKDNEQRNSDASVAVAVQDETSTLFQSVRVENAGDGEACDLVAVAESRDAALQQGMTLPAGPRRRHGGALPT